MGFGIDSSPQFMALDAALSYQVGCDDDWCTQQTISLVHMIRSLDALGHLYNATSEDIASECGWRRDRSLLLDMLIGTGWIAVDGIGGVTLGPSWDTSVVTGEE